MIEPNEIEKTTAAIANKYRLSILLELAKKGSITGTGAQEITGLSQPCVSHHVKLLVDSGLVVSQKTGRCQKLSLNKEVFDKLAGFLKKLSE
ncbi:ArsR/SmtB family transcription factor [Spirosoma spitsbergense]|uniref:ArsR/SmtB family transcription factor n=1 Tax=Spirosoma spitsbergense TaxID=431554 RepID=UPI0003679829|nr:winged helix-turn-helix domain-containing protein [Spirosoma spitsbergense]